MAVDPYTAWLGIPPDRLPPDHYDLLGVPPDEVDPLFLQRATEIRTEMVRKHCGDTHRDIAEKIVGQLQSALACLADPEGRQAYERERLGRLVMHWLESERPPSDFYRVLGQRRFTRFHALLREGLATVRTKLAEVEAEGRAERLAALRTLVKLAEKVTASADACWSYHRPILVRLRQQFASKHGDDPAQWDRKALYVWLQRSARIHPRQVKAVADAMSAPTGQAKELLIAALFVAAPSAAGKAEPAGKKPAAGYSSEEDLESWLLDEIKAVGTSDGASSAESDPAEGALEKTAEESQAEEEPSTGFRCPYPDCRAPLVAAYATIPNLPCPNCGRVRASDGGVMAQSGELQKGMQRKAGAGGTDLTAAWSWLFRMTALAIPVAVLAFVVLCKNANLWAGVVAGPMLTFLMISPFTLAITCETRSKRALDSELASRFALWTGIALAATVGLLVGVVFVILKLPVGASAGVGLPMIGVAIFLLVYIARFCGTLIETMRMGTAAGVRAILAYYVFTLSIVLGVTLLAGAIVFLPAYFWLSASRWRAYLKWLGFRLKIGR